MDGQAEKASHMCALHSLLAYAMACHTPPAVCKLAATTGAQLHLFGVQDRIFDELNTLSVVYRAPATTFIDAEQGAGVQ